PVTGFCRVRERGWVVDEPIAGRIDQVDEPAVGQLDARRHQLSATKKISCAVGDEEQFLPPAARRQNGILPSSGILVIKALNSSSSSSRPHWQTTELHHARHAAAYWF